MTGSPSFEDVSRDLARAFAQRGAKAGDLLGPNNLPGQVLLSNELTDFPRALAIAVRHGWFQKVVNDQYRLTKTVKPSGSPSISASLIACAAWPISQIMMARWKCATAPL
jgi:hypothetical protein